MMIMSHTHPHAHAHRPPLPACPLTAVLSHWACTPVPLAMLSFPHGRASANMGETLNLTKHVPLQWNTPLNDPFFFSLTPSNSFSTVGFSFHATPLSQPFFSGSTRKSKNLVIASLRHSTVLAFCSRDGRRTPKPPGHAHTPAILTLLSIRTLRSSALLSSSSWPPSLLQDSGPTYS